MKAPDAPDSVIFLDAQGVFAALYGRDGEEGIDYECIERINQLAECTNSALVASSSWRQLGQKNVIDKLVGLGFKREHFHPDPCTGTPKDERVEEIREYLERHPEIKRHLALDDNKLKNGPNETIKVQSLKTYPDFGFTNRDFKEACQLLEQQREENAKPDRAQPNVSHPLVIADP